MHSDDRTHFGHREVYMDDGRTIIYTDYGSDHPDLSRYPNGGEEPRDPARAGRVGKYRAAVGAWPDPDGNRAERRAAAKAGRKRLYGGKGGTRRDSTPKRR